MVGCDGDAVSMVTGLGDDGGERELSPPDSDSASGVNTDGGRFKCFSIISSMAFSFCDFREVTFNSDPGEVAFNSDFGKVTLNSDFGEVTFKLDFGDVAFRSDHAEEILDSDLADDLGLAYLGDFGDLTQGDLGEFNLCEMADRGLLMCLSISDCIKICRSVRPLTSVVGGSSSCCGDAVSTVSVSVTEELCFFLLPPDGMAARLDCAEVGRLCTCNNKTICTWCGNSD